MDSFDRIEPETETHRAEKALKTLVEGARLPLKRGAVEIRIGRAIDKPAAQHLLLMLVHLLARMKGIVHTICIPVDKDVVRHRGVPVTGDMFVEGLRDLVDGLSGPKSQFRCDLHIGGRTAQPDVVIGIGMIESCDVTIGADAWRALIGSHVAESRWDDQSPLGPYMAAVMGASEVFKHLLHVNFGISVHRATNVAFSLFDYTVDGAATVGPDLTGSRFELAVGGAGAGGTAALYTLASFPDAEGEITLVEPGHLKESSLGRYLMTDYEQVHDGLHKLDSAEEFLRQHAPGLRLSKEARMWHEVVREWDLVIATVDTPEARRDIQHSSPRAILDAGVIGTIYAVLRVVPGGWCLECKHPPDPDVTWKQRAKRWGLPVDEVKRRHSDRTPVSLEDVRRLAEVQNRLLDDLSHLIGKPFDEVPAIAECGETPLLEVPSQTPMLPLATTAAGVVLAAEAAKFAAGIGRPLTNYFAHDLRYVPKATGQRFRSRSQDCKACP